MKAEALGNRLARDIDEKSNGEINSDTRLEILDAINGGLQRMHAVAPYHSKITTGSISLQAPTTISLGVTHGSDRITGHTFITDQLYGSILIQGDAIYNQVIGGDELLYPYSGATGTVSAVIYWDGVAIPEPYEELVGDPRILETGKSLVNFKPVCGAFNHKPVGEPRFYWMEANAMNQNSPAPTVIRFDSLPSCAFRMEAQFSLSPARITFEDLLASGDGIPLRAEHIECYLLPIARGILTSSRLWKDKESKSAARDDAALAEKRYEMLSPQTMATPRIRVGTKRGY
jgi:hypothetical protein